MNIIYSNKVLFIFCFILLTTNSALSIGWTNPKGKGFFKLGQDIILSKYFYEDDGTVIPIRSTGVFISNFYGELGISDRITVGTFVAFLNYSFVNGVRYTSGRPQQAGQDAINFGDSNVFIRYGLIRNKPLVLAASLLFGIPSGKSQGLLTSGDGEFNQLVKIELGYGFQKIPLFAGFEAGFNNRTNQFSDELRLNAEVGYTWKKFTFILKSRNVITLRNGADEVVAGGIFSNNIQFFSFGPEILISNLLGKIGIIGNFFGALGGANILASPSSSIGIFLKL